MFLLDGNLAADIIAIKRVRSCIYAQVGGWWALLFRQVGVGCYLDRWGCVRGGGGGAVI